jgi:hypothetical protein
MKLIKSQSGCDVPNRPLSLTSIFSWVQCMYIHATRKPKFKVEPRLVYSEIQCDQEPILRLLNLQLQRRRCIRLQHFYIGEKIF